MKLFNFSSSLILALGLMGWVLAFSEINKPKEVFLTIPVTGESYQHGKQLCSLSKQEKNIYVAVQTTKGNGVYLPCSVISPELGGGK